jgi:hypothetical protein
MRGRGMRRALAGGAGLTLAAGMAVWAAVPAQAALPAGCTQSGPGQVVTCSQAWTAAGTFTVPAGVMQVQVTAVGAAGGFGCNTSGGDGASVTDTQVPVSGSQVLQVVVGADGGGAGGGLSWAGCSGGGGGGYSGLFDSSAATLSQSAALVIAAGGGGGGAYADGGGAGDTGTGGGNGGGVASGSCPADGEGCGGTSGTGGAGGTGIQGGGSGDTGEALQGGAGGSGPVGSGGGGGGGYWGGGGGGGDSSSWDSSSGDGGGGSSYVTPSATGQLTETNVSSTTPPSVTISYTDTVSLAKPDKVTVDATSPRGAVVKYVTPAAADALGVATPSVSCQPASGTTFAIGTTTVTCTATDPDASNTGLQVSFTVTVMGAPAQLSDLAGALPGGSGGQLLAPDLAGASSALAAGQKLLGTLDLDKFLAAVAVLQHAGAISPATAQALTAAARQIIAVIGVA